MRTVGLRVESCDETADLHDHGAAAQIGDSKILDVDVHESDYLTMTRRSALPSRGEAAGCAWLSPGVEPGPSREEMATVHEAAEVSRGLCAAEPGHRSAALYRNFLISVRIV